MIEEEFQGTRLLRGYLSRADQESLVEDLRALAAVAPFARQMTPSGRRMSVRMLSAGQYGWVSDSRGYRYQTAQSDGRNWPAIPDRLMALWEEVAQSSRAPQCCLVNYYDGTAKMGLHQDHDEADFDQPVLSISLGDEALFRVGGSQRSDPTRSVWLKSGDVVLLRGASRLAFHGIDKLRFGSSSLLPKGGRLNVTLRVVD